MHNQSISGHKSKNRVIQGWNLTKILLDLYLGHQSIYLVAQRDQWEKMSMCPCRKRRSGEVTSITLEWVELLTLPLTQRAREREEERMERKRESSGEEVKKTESLVMFLWMVKLKDCLWSCIWGSRKKSMSTYFQYSHNFSQSLSTLQGQSQHKQGSAKK